MARPADPRARDALIAAARAEFVRKGLRGARIEDITAACGLSKGAFYLHFSAKEALFRELVEELMTALNRLIVQRKEDLERFFEAHGRLDSGEVAERAERSERLSALHAEGDLRLLELIWAFRDVMHVLLRGSQGTEFESLVWGMVDREVARVARDFDGLQGTGVCRPDVPPAVFGSLIVGTYLLLAQQMSQMEQKPDLAVWANSIHRLIREGSQPSVAPAPAPRKPSPRQSPRTRAHSRTRSTPRSGP
jgi:AcrR family transcriptional regulator